MYADLSGNVLLHASVPALGLRASQWAVISWARPVDAGSFSDSKYSYKCGCGSMPSQGHATKIASQESFARSEVVIPDCMQC